MSGLFTPNEVYTGISPAYVNKLNRNHRQNIAEWKVSRNKALKERNEARKARNGWKERALTYRDALQELVIEYNLPVKEVTNLLKWKERQEVEDFHSYIFVPTEATPDQNLTNQEDQEYIDAINSFVKTLNEIRVQEVHINAEWQAWRATCKELMNGSKASEDNAKKLYASYKKDNVPAVLNSDPLENFRNRAFGGMNDMDDSCKANINFIVEQTKQAAEKLEQKYVYRHGWKSTCIDMAKKLRISGKDLLSIFHENKCRIYEQDFFLD